VLLDSRLLRQRRLETFLNFPRGGLEVCGAVYQRPFHSRFSTRLVDEHIIRADHAAARQRGRLCGSAARDHTIEVRHLFGKRFVSVLSSWCLTCRKPLILLDGPSSAGIANGLWVRSQFGSPGSEANQFQLLKSAWRRPAAIPSPPAADFPDRRPYFPLSLGSLIGTCREVLTILGLPSGWVRLMTVSRSRMNFSASMTSPR
jgi:hypothetical protein